MSTFVFEDSKIMTMDEAVKELKDALNDYALATQTRDFKKAKDLRGVIRNIIRSYQPENTQEGIFDDIISLLPEESMEQFVAVQANILSESDNIVPINKKNLTYMDALAKNFLLGKAGLKLMYNNAQNNLDTMTGSFIDKVANVMSRMPQLPPDYEITDNTLRELVDKSKQNISAAASGIAECKSKMIDNNVESFVSFINVIKNTVERLWNFTPDDYEHQIWGDRSLYVNEDDTLVDPVEQIRLNMIIEEYKKSCGKLPSTPVYNVNQIEKKKYAEIKRQMTAPSSLGKRPKYLEDTEDTKNTDSQDSQDSQDSERTLILTEDSQQDSLPPYYSSDEDEPSSKKPNINTGGKTKKNKRKSKKVKRKSGRKTYKNKRNRRSKRKTRVKK